MRSGLSLAIIAAGIVGAAAQVTSAAVVDGRPDRRARRRSERFEHDDGLAILKAKAKRARRAAKLKQHWKGE